MKYYPKNVGDFMTRTRHLTMTERGAYNELMDAYYVTEKALPSDLAELNRICGAETKVEKAAVKRVAAEFFELRDGLLWHSIIENKIQTYVEASEKNKANGRKGGRPKRTQTEPSGFATDNLVGSQTVSQTKPISRTKNQETKERQSQKQARAAPCELPDWIPADTWADFVEMRRKAKKPLTDASIRLAIRTLQTLKAEGSDPQLVLERSILNGWLGLFPLPPMKGAQRPKSSVFEQNMAAAERAEAMIFGSGGA